MSIVTCDEKQMNVDMCRGGVDTGGGVHSYIFLCLATNFF